MLANLPLKLSLENMQIQWSGTLNQVVSNPIVNGYQISAILANGTTVINHGLSRKMRGWFITDITGAASVYRPNTAPFNDKTLTLVSNAAVTANLWVY